MNFLPTEEQRMAVEGFTRFLETELRPIVAVSYTHLTLPTSDLV
mgnify:CR=1 FL=1